MNYSYPASIQVVKMLITETGTYNDQYRRPFQSHLSASGLRQILENTQKYPKVSPGIFSGLTSQVIAPAATPESMIQIPEGWSERRLKFILEILVNYKTGGSITEIVTGWSETPANTISIYNTMDPNTIFRVNNTIHVHKENMLTDYGNQTRSMVTDCSHVLFNNDWQGVRGGNREWLLRPVDIFSRNISEEVQRELSSEGSMDVSAALMNIAQKSKRTNAVPTNYVSSIIQNYSNAYHQMGITQDIQGDVDALSNAQQYARENAAARDPFLETIASLSGTQVTDAFKLNDILRLDPSAQERIMYVRKGPTEVAQLHQSGQTEGWGGSDLITHIANVLSSTVPSLMISNMIMNIAFVSSNLDMLGQIDTRIANIDGFSQGVNLAPYAQSFVAKFENEILRDIIDNYQVSIGIQMRVDLIGETWISLNINGEKVDYVTPSFSDALLTPVLTQNEATGQQLAMDLKNLMENVVDYSGNRNLSMVSPAVSPGNPVEVPLNYRSLI